MIITEESWNDLETVWDYLDLKMPLPEKADAAVCGGEGKMVDVAERAAELYRLGIVPLLVFSGFANPTLKAERTEAELLAETAMKNGVPESAIMLEPYAANTAENVTKSVALMRRAGINPRRVLLVHKPNMTRRFLATALVNWTPPQPEMYVTSIQMTFRDFYKLDKATYGGDGKLIELMLGDYARIKEYPKRGWMAEQPVHERVEQAYRRLAEAGIKGKAM